MYASITQYQLNPIFENDFLKLWKEQWNHLMAEQMIKSATLHRESRISYIAYTNWTNQEAFNQYIHQPEENLHQILLKMEECCNSIRIPFRMHTLEEDLE